MKTKFFLAVSICATLILGMIAMDNQSSGQDPPPVNIGDIQKYGQFVCAWKTGAGADVVKAIKDQGFDIVLRSEPGAFAICKWKGKLDQDAINKLLADKSIRYIVPDPPMEMAEQEQPKKGKEPVTDATLLAYKKSGAIVCAWEPQKKKDAIDAVKKLGLNIELRSDEGAFLICSWKGELKKETLEALSDLPSIRYVEPDQVVALDPSIIQACQPLVKAPKTGQSVCRPNDPLYGELYGMENIRASNAWCCVQASPAIVAVIDSGIDANHEDLRDNTRKDLGRDFIRTVDDGIPGKDPQDGDGHGTHVSGTIGAVGNNGVGVAGVCWRVQIVALRVFDDKGGGGSNARIAAAIQEAIKIKARVVNLSLSGRVSTPPLQEAVEKAEKEGVLLVCAAGNLRKDDRELDNDKLPVFPANYPNKNIIAVAAIDKNNAFADFSHFGQKTVHLAAPGVDIKSTFPGSKYGLNSGTSMATPHVTGAAALILGHDKFKTADFQQVRNLVLTNARKTAGLETKCTTGGTLDIGFLCPTSNPPIVVNPPPPVYIYYPPPYHCPQFPFRIFRRCR